MFNAQTTAIARITPRDAGYPTLLTRIHKPPEVLHVRGILPPPDALYIAVVGTRVPTTYGEQVTHEIVTALARAGLVVVSGLALGIDGAAHRAAFEAGGRTIAVLGSGIDDASVYPPRHRGLANDIVAHGGAVISEYPPGTSPTKYTFPERNRIIAGMSVGVIVIEAKEKSGALITAEFAVEDGREVFAVPGPITSEASYGPNRLIKSGAHPVTSVADIFTILGIAEPSESTAPELEGVEAHIFAALGREPVHIDALADTTKLDIATLSSTLAAMELRGLVKNIGAMHFIRI